jgi:hypothetical protein
LFTTAGGADEPPMVMLHSRRDDKHMVVWFRDYELLVPHFHHKIMTLGTNCSHYYYFLFFIIIISEKNIKSKYTFIKKLLLKFHIIRSATGGRVPVRGLADHGPRA